MTARSACSRSGSNIARLLLAGSAVLTLIATPAGLAIDDGHLGVAWQAALAKNDGGGPGNGGGNGGGQGGGHDGGQGQGRGHGYGHGPGPGRGDPRMDEAKARYRDALEPPGRAHTQVPAGFTKQHGPDLDRGPAYGLAPDETRALIERGWKGPKTQDGFKNHGQRTRTMVELAKRLGYSARVGAMQANFGTPFENGIAELEDQLAAAAGNQPEVERLEAELEAAITAAKPGKGPDDSWATADLDVNDDGAVDTSDLDALDQTTPANEPAS